MSSFKKFITILALLCIALMPLCACNGNIDEDPIEIPGPTVSKGPSPAKIIIKVANDLAEEHPQNISLKQTFKPLIERESKGEIKVEVYPNNLLGAEKDFIEGTKIGTVEMALMGVSLSDQFPKLMVQEFPYLFNNVRQGFEVLNGEVGREVSKELSGIGLKSLGYTVNGARVISNNKKPIYTLSDCKDIKICVPQIRYFADMGTALGFDVVAMPISEIFASLQQKTIEGQENTASSIYSNGWYEVQRYIALTNHIISYSNVVINEGFYNSLSENHKRLLEKVVGIFKSEVLEMYLAVEQSDIEKLKAKGVEFTTPDSGEFRQAIQPVYEKYFQESADFKEVVERILER